jgi:hypothetical protein
MAYTRDISGFTMFNAWKMISEPDESNFLATMEQEYNIKIIEYEIIQTVKWNYTVEFPSESAATLFLLRFS